MLHIQSWSVEWHDQLWTLLPSAMYWYNMVKLFKRHSIFKFTLGLRMIGWLFSFILCVILWRKGLPLKPPKDGFRWRWKWRRPFFRNRPFWCRYLWQPAVCFSFSRMPSLHLRLVGHELGLPDLDRITKRDLPRVECIHVHSVHCTSFLGNVQLHALKSRSIRFYWTDATICSQAARHPDNSCGRMHRTQLSEHVPPCHACWWRVKNCAWHGLPTCH